MKNDTNNNLMCGARDNQATKTKFYDRFTNNYKIIAISSCNNHNKVVNVHTLGTDYWRRIQDFPNHYPVPRPGIFVSDAANWLAHDRRSNASIIVSLDLEKELSQELLHPLCDNQQENYIILGVLRDCLCIFSQSDKFFDVWIMKEYGNGQSWTKLLSVPQMGDHYIYTKPLYISEDDQVLMYFVKRGKFSLAFYDSINDTFKIPEAQNNIHDLMIPEVCIPEVHFESLISPLSQY
ncbi:F-box protein interaction domain protein [Medicago truncatula]|uniref:F-box protein interaction domain protein n=1 Tax=Medicago truncatula TaxID=3880 RepID=A0A072VRN8_MEDTR|nr:F-box protein interaction domain protein [Medicago truncatula]